MNYLTIIILIFSVLGALDCILGNRFGLGKEFEKGFMLLGTMALAMIGMIVMAPVIAGAVAPVSNFVSDVLGIDSSIIPAVLFANDMGGAALAVEMAQDADIGMFNALVVSSMMGGTISFGIPFAIGAVDKSLHKEMFLGFLCGIATISVGCFVSGIICKLPIGTLITNLIPLVLFSGIIVVGLIFVPEKCIKVFTVLGIFVKSIIMIGLLLGIVKFLSGKELIAGIGSIEEGAAVCLNAAVVLSGAFPLMYVVSKVLSKPLKVIGQKVGMNEVSVMGIISSLVTSVTAFGTMDKMDKKGVVMNTAFIVSAAYIFGSHLAFTMAFNSAYIVPVFVGKLVAGISALVLVNIVFHTFYHPTKAVKSPDQCTI